MNKNTIMNGLLIAGAACLAVDIVSIVGERKTYKKLIASHEESISAMNDLIKDTEELHEVYQTALNVSETICESTKKILDKEGQDREPV